MASNIERIWNKKILIVSNIKVEESKIRKMYTENIKDLVSQNLLEIFLNKNTK